MCPVQLLIERDFLGSRGIYGREINPTPENIAFDTMLDVDLGFGRNYFESTHTLQNFRQNVWLPQMIDREGWKGYAQYEALLDKAQAKFEDLLAQYQKPEVWTRASSTPFVLEHYKRWLKAMGLER